MKPALILALLAVSGCQTCREHRAICTAVAVGIAAGSLAASDSHRTQAHDVGVQPVTCNQSNCK